MAVVGIATARHAEGPHGMISKDRRLSATDKRTIVRWIEGGASAIPPNGSGIDKMEPAGEPTDWAIPSPETVRPLRQF